MGPIMKLGAALLASAALLAGCASTVNPVTGQSERTMMSVAQEQRQGALTHPKVIAAYGGAYNEGGVGAYVSQLGQKLAAQSQIPTQQFTFTVLDSPDANAFAVPGGYVYITRGMLALANNEAELAGVLAHEIGHIAARHTAQRQTRAAGAGIAATLATLGAAAIGIDPSIARGLGQIGQTAAKGYVAQFSQSQELEADQLGLDYITRAGYDPYALPALLRNMQRQEELHARLEGEGYDPNSVSFFATHPATGARVNRSVGMAQATGAPVNNAAMRGDAALMRALDGVVYGGSRQHGFARGSRFYHPEMGFSFTAPAGWEIENKPSLVIVKADQGGAIAGLNLAERTGDLRAMLAGMLRGQRNVSQIERININGMQAVTALADGSVSGKAAKIRLVLIDAGERIYRFQMLAPLNAGLRFDNQFKALATSFRRLSPGEAAGLQPLRLRTRRAGPGDSVASLAAQTGFEDNREARFRVMNGLAPGEPLRPGRWVKLAQ